MTLLWHFQAESAIAQHTASQRFARAHGRMTLFSRKNKKTNCAIYFFYWLFKFGGCTAAKGCSPFFVSATPHNISTSGKYCRCTDSRKKYKQCGSKGQRQVFFCHIIYCFSVFCNAKPKTLPNFASDCLCNEMKFIQITPLFLTNHICQEKS